MKKMISFLIIILVIFSFSVYAQEEQNLNTEDTELETLNLSQEKSFSQSARDELLGIASQFDSEEEQGLTELNFQNDELGLTETTLNNSQHLNLLRDLNFDASYSQQEDQRLETSADFQLEYALNSRTFIRAGYSLLNEEWWDVERNNSAEPDTNNEDQADDSQQESEEADSESSDFASADNSIRRVYQNETESSSSLGVAYQSSDRVVLSADFIDNNRFGGYYDENWEIAGDSTIFGLEYNYPEGSSIRARYQIDTAEDVTQRITGLDFAFNNLATFSASYKLLDPNELENTLIQQQTAWDLGLGVSLNEDYGLALGYELIESENQEEAERKIKASFEINF